MRRPLVLGLAALSALGLGAIGYRLLVPRIGTVPREEIEAALPASLKIQDTPDPAGEARYARLVASLRRLDEKPFTVQASTAGNERVLREVAGILAQGPIRKPVRPMEQSFPKLKNLKDGAKAFAYAVQAARRRGDRAACGRWVLDGLRFADALSASGGVVIDGLVQMALDAIAVRAAYVAEIDGGLDAVARERLLDSLPAEDGSSPAMADAVRRDFQGYFLPTLLDPRDHAEDLAEAYSAFEEDPESPPRPMGTFDPLATARLAGKVYDARIADLRRPYARRTRIEDALVERAARGLPEAPTDSEGERVREGWNAWLFRLRMNWGENTLGRSLLAHGVLSQLGVAVARQAASRNLLRATLLLRMGREAVVPDPLGVGLLRIDRKRRIVWSVGTNGKDDGGAIGKGGETLTPDLGFPYGDRSFPIRIGDQR